MSVDSSVKSMERGCVLCSGNKFCKTVRHTTVYSRTLSVAGSQHSVADTAYTCTLYTYHVIPFVDPTLLSCYQLSAE